MKYEMIFGDEKLFDGAHERATHATKGGGFYYIDSGVVKFISNMGFSDRDVCELTGYLVAERRIIKEQKRWTLEDKKAGRLPEVGAKVDGGKVVFVNGFNVVTELKSGAVIVSSPKTFLNTFKPIETPEEKAARLREEWCIKALSSCSILSGMQKYELKRLGGYIEDIYDALLSGELPIPGKDGE